MDDEYVIYAFECCSLAEKGGTCIQSLFFVELVIIR